MKLFEILQGPVYIGTMNYGFSVMAPYKQVSKFLTSLGDRAGSTLQAGQFATISKDSFDQYPQDHKLVFQNFESFAQFITQKGQSVAS